MPLNTRLLRQVVQRDAKRVLIKRVRPLIELDFNTKKEQFMRAFDDSTVTKELKAGPHAFSSISALATTGGNLFSFLGFYQGEDPAGALREYLNENITLKRTSAGEVRGDKVVFKTKVSFPTVADVDRAMQEEVPLDWDSRAFTDRISKGAPGLPNYLFREDPPFGSPEPSRSSTAVQTHGKALRGGSFGGVPYMGDLLGVLKRLLGPKR